MDAKTQIQNALEAARAELLAQRTAEAIRILTETVATFEDSERKSGLLVQPVLRWAEMVHQNESTLEEAHRLLRRAIALAEDSVDGPSERVANAKCSAALIESTLSNAECLEQAASLYRDGIREGEVAGANAWWVAYQLTGFAGLLLGVRPEEALDTARRAVLVAASIGPEEKLLLEAQFYLGRAELACGRPREAAATFGALRDARRRQRPTPSQKWESELTEWIERAKSAT